MALYSSRRRRPWPAGSPACPRRTGGKARWPAGGDDQEEEAEAPVAAGVDGDARNDGKITGATVHMDEKKAVARPFSDPGSQSSYFFWAPSVGEIPGGDLRQKEHGMAAVNSVPHVFSHAPTLI